MKKTLSIITVFLLTLLSLNGCSMIGNKNGNLSIVYFATTLLSIFLLIIYCVRIKKKCSWYYLLFSSFIIVNAGYFTLSVSTVVEEALLANRIAYLGSAFLPLAMLMIIWRACDFKAEKYLAIPLFLVSSMAFGIAATPGYSDVYYKSTQLGNINGVTILEKEYGPLHSFYLYYLLLYFGLMIASIIVASYKKKLQSRTYVTILLFAVSINLLVWLMGQLVSIEFEFLSISYIVCGIFLLCFEVMRQDLQHSESIIQNENISTNNNTPENIIAIDTSEKTDTKKSPVTDFSEYTDEELLQLKHFKSQLSNLTTTEKEIFNYYVSGKTTKDIMAILEIKESTLKYHNRNIYSKLGVSSRKQLITFSKKFNNFK